MARSRTLSSSGCQPLYATRRTPGRRTLGPRLGQIAEILGKPLMPWQRQAADVALEVVPGPGPLGFVPAYDQVILVVMRQQGKTEFLFPLMTHRATGFGDAQQIRYTTQTGYEARKKWEDIHVERLEHSPLKPLFRTRKQLNREAIIWSNGSHWSPQSPTGKLAGDTLDLGVIDEGWSRVDDRVELGWRPAMLTRPGRQLWVCSMVPGATRAKNTDSAYLREKMRMGRAMVAAGMTRGTCYIEFGADEGQDPADPATWWGCMPALGRTIQPEAVASDYEALDLVDFEAEYLSWWPMDHIPVWTTITERTWIGLRDRSSKVQGRVALALDANKERTAGFMGIAGRRFDNDYHVEIVEPGHRVPLGTLGLEWMLESALEFVDRHDPLAVVIDPKSAAASLIPLLRNRDVEVMTPNTLEIAGACARFFDATGQEVPKALDGEPDAPRVRHIGQAEVNRAVAGARKLASPTDGTFRWARVGSTTNISPLYCVTLAMHGFELKQYEDYDVLDSVG